MTSFCVHPYFFCFYLGGAFATIIKGRVRAHQGNNESPSCHRQKRGGGNALGCNKACPTSSLYHGQIMFVHKGKTAMMLYAHRAYTINKRGAAVQCVCDYPDLFLLRFVFSFLSIISRLSLLVSFSSHCRFDLSSSSSKKDVAPPTLRDLAVSVSIFFYFKASCTLAFLSPPLLFPAPYKKRGRRAFR